MTENMKNRDPKGKIGDDDFKDAIVKYRERIFLVILKYVRNREDARDITQDAFLRAYKSRASFRGDSSLYTWIFRIAVNLALNFKERSHISDLSSIEDTAELYSSSDPMKSIRDNEIARSIDQSVKLLPERQRMTFVLRYYEELPFAEIAGNLGITEGAAKANYHQAIKKMQVNLRKFVEDAS